MKIIDLSFLEFGLLLKFLEVSLLNAIDRGELAAALIVGQR